MPPVTPQEACSVIVKVYDRLKEPEALAEFLTQAGLVNDRMRSDMNRDVLDDEDDVGGGRKFKDLTQSEQDSLEQQDEGVDKFCVHGG